MGLPPLELDNGVVTQALCMGWTMTGHEPASGIVSQFPMTITNNATLTWLSATNWYFHDDFETGFTHWSRTGTWWVTPADAVSPTHSAADSPGAFYTNNSDTAMSMAGTVSLMGMSHPVLHFWTKYDLEDGYDFVYAEASTNSGVSWSQLPGGTFTGTEQDWTEQQFDLSAWSTCAAFKVRFHLVADASVVKDGWYADDVHIGDAPPPLPAWRVANTANTVTLAWNPPLIGDFAAYRIYRSQVFGQPWQNGILIGTVTAQDTTSFTDATAAPKPGPTSHNSGRHSTVMVKNITTETFNGSFARKPVTSSVMICGAMEGALL
jgi:hypothetical protein